MYVGLDIVEGSNVDIVSREPYDYPVESDSFDVIVSGSTAEHVRDLHRWIIELKRIVKKGA
jgi:SAM-dependent methyltransferase